MYYPDRVLRQFGYKQKIPDPPIDKAVTEKLHKTTRQGRIDVDWVQRHKDHVLAWNRGTSPELPDTDKGLEVADGYVDWYRSITRRKITPPDAFGPFVDRDIVEGFHPPDVSLAQSVEDITTRMLRDYDTHMDQAMLNRVITASINELRAIACASLNRTG